MHIARKPAEPNFAKGVNKSGEGHCQQQKTFRT